MDHLVSIIGDCLLMLSVLEHISWESPSVECEFKEISIVVYYYDYEKYESIRDVPDAPAGFWRFNKSDSGRI